MELKTEQDRLIKEKNTLFHLKFHILYKTMYKKKPRDPYKRKPTAGHLIKDTLEHTLIKKIMLDKIPELDAMIKKIQIQLVLEELIQNISLEQVLINVS